MTSFKPAWWLKNSHAQTIWSTLFRIPVPMEKQWERIELVDGDFIDLVWDKENYKDENKPIIFFLHGLGGGINSPYSTGLLQAFSRKGWRPVMMHFRGCSGTPNRLPRGYHSGGTKDLAYIVDILMKRNPNISISAVGLSLGGNVLLKWLGVLGSASPLKAAAAVSVPFSLDVCANQLMHGFCKIYQKEFLKSIKRQMRMKFNSVACPLDIKILDRLHNFWEFDDKITAPLHGFNNVYDYYNQASCMPYLKKITVPTLIIQSMDDPFMTIDGLPKEAEISSSIVMNVTEKGGHMGFIEGNIPFFPSYWLEKRLPEFFSKTVLSRNL